MAVAALQPKDDPFYSYTGPRALESIAPGTVLKTRSFPYHIFGLPTLLETTQLLHSQPPGLTVGSADGDAVFDGVDGTSDRRRHA
ncbi:MAG TPA: hypothetical protein VEF72_13725 [Mycobacterium sp.]|nr:hypothetical protein [Mycobacterium sp.]